MGPCPTNVPFRIDMSPTLIDPHLRVLLLGGGSRAFSLDEAMNQSVPTVLRSVGRHGTTIDRASLFFLCLFWLECCFHGLPSSSISVLKVCTAAGS